IRYRSQGGRPLLRGADRGRGAGGAGGRRSGAARGAGAAAYHAAAAVQRAPGGGQVPRRLSRRAARLRDARPAAARPGRGSKAPARQLVRHRLSRAEADQLGITRRPARKADGLRGGARDPRLDRPEEPARGRPPLIFVEVALVSGMAGNIHALLDETAPIGDPYAADSAIFYSISNCQRGLVGISFGDFLIKRVVDALAQELPRLKTFATLSPVPGFRAWLERQRGEDLLLPSERAALQNAAGEEVDLVKLLDRPGWHEEPRLAAALREPLLRLCARYLVHERGSRRRALDPVAHFHLSNGARIERLNWLGDVSPKGLQQSAGIMVNYLYRLHDIEANHEAYRGEGRVAAAMAIRALARSG